MPFPSLAFNMTNGFGLGLLELWASLWEILVEITVVEKPQGEAPSPHEEAEGPRGHQPSRRPCPGASQVSKASPDQPLAECHWMTRVNAALSRRIP